MAQDTRERNCTAYAPLESAPMPTLQLSKTEEDLCVLLDDACRWIESTQPQPDLSESGGVQVEYTNGWKLEARIAGGWVRDKLLGYESHDLDISLSSLTGHIFALLLRSYLLSDAFAASSLANESGSSFYAGSSTSDNLVGHITRIAANPEQSKNLETATAIVAGLQLDFVNLRKEIYVGSSRIPTMTFGTPHEDAERRDITINSLFFNVRNRVVEDYTGKGLADMKAKVIRTPLSPQRTFLEDPLRVLRCVRFASRLGYEIDKEIKQCFQGGEGEMIVEALRTKVSRERFGIEVDKMMRGPDPYRAIQLIWKLRLFEIIFGPPLRPSPPEEYPFRGTPRMPAAKSLTAANLVNQLWEEARRRQAGEPAQESIPTEMLQPLLNENSRRLLFYSALLLPFEGIEWDEKWERRIDQLKERKAKGIIDKNVKLGELDGDKWLWIGEWVTIAGLKLAKDTKESLSYMVKAVTLLNRPVAKAFDASDARYRGNLIPALADSSVSPKATMALLIRQPCISSPHLGLSLPLCLLWAMVQDLSRMNNGTLDNGSVYVDFFCQLQEYQLLERVYEKPLLDGKEILAALEIKKASKDVQTILKSVEAWQFSRDISAEEREKAKMECKNWLKEEWAKGGIIPMKRRVA